MDKMSKQKPGRSAKIKKEENFRAIQRNQVLEILKAGVAIAKVSGNGTFSFNQRSLFYVVRALLPGLEYSYFRNAGNGFRERAWRHWKHVFKDRALLKTKWFLLEFCLRSLGRCAVSHNKWYEE